MAVTASMQPELGHIVYAGSNFPHPFQLHFSKEDMDHIVQNRSRWPGQGLARRIWSGSKPRRRNHLARFLAGRNRPAASFRLSDSVPFFHRHPGPRYAKPDQIQFSSDWLCQVWAKQIRSRSKPVCKDHPARFWPTLQSRSRSDVNQIRHVSWVCWLHAVYSNTSC